MYVIVGISIHLSCFGHNFNEFLRYELIYSILWKNNFKLITYYLPDFDFFTVDLCSEIPTNPT